MNWIKPDRIYVSIDQIDFTALAGSGKRLILLDIDNTLVHHGAHQADDFARRIVQRIKAAGLTPYIISNAKPSRAKLFANSLGIAFQGLSGKPSTRGLQRAMNEVGCPAHETVMIGDQLFTDVLAARRAGVLAVLVLPLDSHEVWNVAIKRAFEWPFLRQYRREADLWPPH